MDDRPGDPSAGARRWVIKTVVFVVVMLAVLFGTAGRWDWGAGWALVALYCLQQIAVFIGLWRLQPDLLGERADSRAKAGVKAWDRWLTLFGALLLPVLTMVVAGLDARYGWTGDTGQGWALVGGSLTVAGMVVTSWAMLSNAYFSGLVRIQAERGHTVVSGGPYHTIRHPGYAGALLYNIGVPLLLGSWWALIPSGLACLLMILRTALEDRFLRAELPGYAGYAARVRYRLLPGVW